MKLISLICGSASPVFLWRWTPPYSYCSCFWVICVWSTILCHKYAYNCANASSQWTTFAVAQLVKWYVCANGLCAQWCTGTICHRDWSFFAPHVVGTWSRTPWQAKSLPVLPISHFPVRSQFTVIRKMSKWWQLKFSISASFVGNHQESPAFLNFECKNASEWKSWGETYMQTYIHFTQRIFKNTENGTIFPPIFFFQFPLLFVIYCPCVLHCFFSWGAVSPDHAII